MNADGAGPYTCDLDPTGNSLGATGQTPLTVTNNVPGSNGFSQAKTQDFNMTVTLPADLDCTGGSTGNICTVRCRNNALAGPFGGCVAVQQVDTKAKTNVAAKITTAASKTAVDDQVQQDQKDLPDAVAANQAAGTAEQLAAADKVAQLIQPTIVSSAQAVQTPAADAANAAAGAQPTGAANNGKTVSIPFLLPGSPTFTNSSYRATAMARRTKARAATTTTISWEWLAKGFRFDCLLAE